MKLLNKNNIILIHSGNVFPEHVNDCITQLKKYNFNIHLILSRDLHKFVNNSSEIFLSCVEDYINEYYQNFFVARDNTFRDGFWTRTSSRFFLISEYSKKNNITNFFHIENDVLLFDSLEKVDKILQDSIFDLSIVVDSDIRCVPSIMWSRNFFILEKLGQFIFSNKNNDDMTNLKLFYDHNLNKITNFPIIHTEQYNSSKIKYNNMFSEFSCIFDGAAIGQYLGGVDPRNTAGNTIGFINESTVFNVSKYNYTWLDSEPYIIFDDVKIKIINLHVHSKNLKKLMSKAIGE